MSLASFEKHDLIMKNKKKIKENEALLGSEKEKIINRFSAIFVRRNSRIPPWFIGNKIFLTRGNSVVSFVVSPAAVGHYFGEFAYTRVFTKGVKKKKKNKWDML